MAENTTTGNRSRSYDEIRAAREAKITGTITVKKKDGWIRQLVIAGIIALIIRTFFFEAFRIPTGSMKNTLLVGDYLFVNKIGYFLQTPKYIPFTEIEIPHIHLKTFGVTRGDVVVFEYPGDRDEVVPHEKKVNYIKRCIGVPGDVIQIKEKQVYVNDSIFHFYRNDSTYNNPPESIIHSENDAQYTNKPGEVDPRLFPRGKKWNKDNFGPLRIPKIGDVVQLNKDNFDQWEVFIEREGHKIELAMNDQIMIDGKPATQYKVQRDYLWMMGDNRDDSEDSRFWGFAPVDNVVGSGMIIYWSLYNPPSEGTGDGYDPDEIQKFQIRWNRIGSLIH
jgi:signal peptidase I